MNAKTITTAQVKDLAASYGIEYAALMAVITVESSGVGFNPPTGNLIIRFEEHWFEREFADWKNRQGDWLNLPHGNQAAEYKKFNSAYAINPTAAMLATSVGMMQVMGFHYSDLGFKSVNEMWDYAKQSEYNQVDLGLRFIKSEPVLLKALQAKNWALFALHYNGSLYAQNHYDMHLLTAYKKFI